MLDVALSVRGQAAREVILYAGEKLLDHARSLLVSASLGGTLRVPLFPVTVNLSRLTLQGR